jgi:hypothetical protein
MKRFWLARSFVSWVEVILFEGKISLRRSESVPSPYTKGSTAFLLRRSGGAP